MCKYVIRRTAANHGAAFDWCRLEQRTRAIYVSFRAAACLQIDMRRRFARLVSFGKLRLELRLAMGLGLGLG